MNWQYYSPSALKLALGNDLGQDGETCIPRWHGEECDYGMVIDALLRRDELGRPRLDAFS